jgi:transcriptional regulator with XRE-family HTH domain
MLIIGIAGRSAARGRFHVNHELHPGADSDPTDVWIGKRIKTLREARGMSQESLAKAIGVTFQQVQKYEKGANRVSGGRLAKIATALKCEVSELFPPNDSVRPERDLTGYANDYESLRVLRAYGEIADATVRAAILTLVEFIAKSS